MEYGKERKRIAFINPPSPFDVDKPFSRQSRSPCVSLSRTLYFPYTLCLACGAIDREGRHQTMILDAVEKKLDTKQTIEKVRHFGADFAVIETSTPSIHFDIAFALELARDTAVNPILVGKHVTQLPEQVYLLYHRQTEREQRLLIPPYMGTPPLLVLGDYTLTIRNIVNGVPFDKIPNLCYLTDDGPIYQNDITLQIEAKDLPWLARVYKEHSMVGPGKYHYSSLHNPYILLMKGIGCPFDCTFCNEIYHGRKNCVIRTPWNVVDEMKYVRDELPEVKEILFDDPTFVSDRGWIEEFCSGIINAKLKLPWSIMTRADIELGTLRLMKKAGCRLHHVGIETTSEAQLLKIRKGLTFSKQEQYLRDMRKVGMLVHGCFVLGLPGDTPESLENTMKQVKRLPLDTIQVFPLIPYPGTDAMTWAEDGGFIKLPLFDPKRPELGYDWRESLTPEGGYKMVISRPDLTAEQVEFYVKKMISSFYLRPSYFLYKLKKSTNRDEAERTWQGGLHFLKNFVLRR